MCVRLCVCWGGRGKEAPREGGGGGGRPQLFPPVSPRGERACGCGRPPAALRGIAAELRPFLFRRFLPLSPGACRVGAPAPRPPAAAPPRLPLHAALARLRKGLVSPGPRPHRRAGRVAGWGPCRVGRGSAGEDPAGLRHQLHCAGSGAGGGGPGEGTALQLLRPRPHPPIPQKNAAAAVKPIAVCITSCLLLFLPGPRAPPGWGGNRGAVRVARLETAQCPHGGLGKGGIVAFSLPRGAAGEGWLRSRAALPAAERMRTRGVAGGWRGRGRGGGGGRRRRGRTAAVGGCRPGRAPVALGGLRTSRCPAGRCQLLPRLPEGIAGGLRERRTSSPPCPGPSGGAVPSGVPHKRGQEEGLGFSRPFSASDESGETVAG